MSSTENFQSKYVGRQDFCVGIEQKKDYCNICSLHMICTTKAVCDLLFCSWHWQDAQLYNLKGSANMFFISLGLTKVCIIKHVTTLLSTIKCSCDGNLGTSVLVLLSGDAHMMEFSSPTAAMTLYTKFMCTLLLGQKRTIIVRCMDCKVLHLEKAIA